MNKDEKINIVMIAVRKFRSAINAMGLDIGETWAQNFETDIIPAFEKIIKYVIDEATKKTQPKTTDQEKKYPDGNMGESLYGDDDPFPFGKYGPAPKGSCKKFSEVPRSYFEFLLKTPWIEKWEGVVKYIKGEKSKPYANINDDPFGNPEDNETPF